MGRELDLFLKQHEVPKGTPVTHCGAGTWNIPPEDEPELRRLIADAQHVPYVVEDTLSSGCAPLVLDLDFNAPVEPAGEERLWQVSGLKEGWVETLTKGCYDVYSRLLGGVPMFVMFYMLERPAGYWSVGKQKWVDGIHIHAPRLFCDLAIHRHARELVLAALPPELRAVLTGTWDTSFNASARPGKGKLAMFGTGKGSLRTGNLEPDARPYQLSEVYSVTAKAAWENKIYPTRAELVAITSIRIEQQELRLREGVVLPKEVAVAKPVTKPVATPVAVRTLDPYLAAAGGAVGGVKSTPIPFPLFPACRGAREGYQAGQNIKYHLEKGQKGHPDGTF
jgi:hypothetical protein